MSEKPWTLQNCTERNEYYEGRAKLYMVQDVKCEWVAEPWGVDAVEAL